MTERDLARIEQALTDEVLDNAYIRSAWHVASQHSEKTDWQVVRQNAAAVMRDILMDAIRRACPAEAARTCATCGRWVPDTSDPTFGATIAPAQEPE